MTNDSGSGNQVQQTMGFGIVKSRKLGQRDVIRSLHLAKFREKVGDVSIFSRLALTLTA